jgi:peptidoglycan/xylan/chitin deacetylase (PgdA/CDA1 family)
MICFDDGFQGIWDTRNFFIANNIYPTVFIAVELIGTNGYLGKEDILSLQSLGFNFQSHAWSHTDLTKFSEHQLKHELNDSQEYLSDFLGKEVNEICFPQGHYSEKVYKASIDAGYKKLYTCIPGNYHDNIGKNLLTRNLVQFSSPSELKSILNGGLKVMRRRYTKLHYKIQ